MLKTSIARVHTELCYPKFTIKFYGTKIAVICQKNPLLEVFLRVAKRSDMNTGLANQWNSLS